MERWASQLKQYREMTLTEEGIKTDAPTRSFRLSASLPSIIETSKTLPSKQMKDRGKTGGAEIGTEQQTDPSSFAHERLPIWMEGSLLECDTRGWQYSGLPFRIIRGVVGSGYSNTES
jgi:hypothetical protein